MLEHQNKLSVRLPRLMAPRRKKRWAAGLSYRKILRVAIVLTMTFLCWLGVGCFAFEIAQLAGR
jgi:hypothetical protein